MKNREKEISSGKKNKIRNDVILVTVILVIAVTVLLFINATKVHYYRWMFDGTVLPIILTGSSTQLQDFANTSSAPFIIRSCFTRGKSKNLSFINNFS